MKFCNYMGVMAAYTYYGCSTKEDLVKLHVYCSMRDMLEDGFTSDHIGHGAYVRSEIVKFYDHNIYKFDAEDIDEVPDRVRKTFPPVWFFIVDSVESMSVLGSAPVDRDSYHVVSKEKIDPIEFMFAHKDECI